MPLAHMVRRVTELVELARQQRHLLWYAKPRLEDAVVVHVDVDGVSTRQQ